jgi:hypothetical protein
MPQLVPGFSAQSTGLEIYSVISFIALLSRRGEILNQGIGGNRLGPGHGLFLCSQGSRSFGRLELDNAAHLPFYGCCCSTSGGNGAKHASKAKARS